MSRHGLVVGMMVVALLCGSLLCGSASARSQDPPLGDLSAVGTVTFPTSCAAKGQPTMVRAVALLHSFHYAEARRLFSEIAAQDKTCAIAQWGIAMTWWHPLWAPPTDEELKAGTAAVDAA